MQQRVKVMGLAVVCAALASLAGGCVHQAVSADVPLRRVVLYRNGVGYFERAGEVEGDSLRFRVRRELVGDFLATLAVIDSRGHARSVSFPTLDRPEEEREAELEEIQAAVGDDDEGEDHGEEIAAALEARERRRSQELIDVDLQLGGGDDHDLVVAYVVETPIWRPSYRVVIDQRQALLQGWAVVQNLSGEDWTNVSMSVTSGAPLSFRSDLARPVIPERPLVSDSGEVIAAAVHGETALRTREPPPPPAPPPPAVETASTSTGTGWAAQTAPGAAAPARRASRPSATRAGGGGMGSGHGRGGERYEAEGEYYDGAAESQEYDREAYGGLAGDNTVATEQTIGAEELASSVRSLAAGVVQEGVTRYDVTEPVTVPNNGSTMVAIINQTIPGEDALLFRPDPAVPDSATHPMRVVRLENATGVLLERGPVAIYQRGALLGQGLLDSLPAGATTTIPFALERGVSVEVEQRNDETTGRLVAIANGRLTVEQFSQRSTTYRIRNGLDRATRLFLRHARMVNWEIVDPPEGTENVEGAALLPVELAAGTDREFSIVERTPTRRVVDLMTDLGAQVLALYLEGPAIDAAAGPVLRQALQHRQRLVEISQNRARLDTERQELRGAQADVQSNLAAIREISRASDLRERLTRRLSELSSRIDNLTNQIVELDAERSEMQVRMSETLRDLTLEVPPSAQQAPAPIPAPTPTPTR
jgi:hypothetical protein